MTAEAATLYLANAWHDVTGKAASVATVAVLWAQWALETGRGSSMVDYNFAGLKGSAPNGTGVLWWTSEGDGPASRRVRGRFRAYPTPEAGAHDYVRVLRDKFGRAFVAAEHGDARAFVQGLESRGYFTGQADEYERALVSLAREFLGGNLAVDAGLPLR